MVAFADIDYSPFTGSYSSSERDFAGAFYLSSVLILRLLENYNFSNTDFLNRYRYPKSLLSYLITTVIIILRLCKIM